MKRIHGLYAALLVLSPSAGAQAPQKLKVQFEVSLQRQHKWEQINSNAVLVPGADWQTMSKDRSLMVQGRAVPLNAESGRFEFQILDTETQKVLSTPTIVGMYGEESAIRNTSKNKDGYEILDFEVKIKPTVVNE